MNYKAAPKGGPLNGVARVTMGYPRGGIDSRTKQPTQREELKIETPHGIIRVMTGIIDDHGRDSMIVEVGPDGDRYAGEVPAWGRLRRNRGGVKRGIRYDVYRLRPDYKKRKPKPSG